MKVFVYGTLLQDLALHDTLTDSNYLGPALVNGELFDLGAFPGLQQGLGEVVGEVYEISTETLAQIDRIEGYNETHPEASLFLREQVLVEFLAAGDTAEVFAYFYGSPIEQCAPIRHGDYRRHLLEQHDGRQWILSFGSNLSGPRLEERVGGWPEHMVGWLPGFELAFNKVGLNGNVYANCRFTGSGFCPAVAYALTPEQTMELDPYEAGYLRVGIPFETTSGKQLVQAYLTHPDNLVPESIPKAGYQAHLEAGYHEHGLDWQCLEDALERVGGQSNAVQLF